MEFRRRRHSRTRRLLPPHALDLASGTISPPPSIHEHEPVNGQNEGARWLECLTCGLTMLLLSVHL